MNKTLLASILLISAVLLSPAAWSADASRLGKDLTPLGAEQAGNADGSIPAWTGGITTPPAGYKVGMHHPDPFAGDQPLYTITAGNAAQYESKLAAGTLALLKAYPDYKLIVYPSRRSASNPQRIYDATKANVATAKLVSDGNGISGAIVGAPFPIPDNGLEVLWNFLTRYRGVAANRHIGQAAVERGGGYQLVQFEDEFLFNYTRPDITAKELEGVVDLGQAPDDLTVAERSGCLHGHVTGTDEVVEELECIRVLDRIPVVGHHVEH